MYMQVILCCYNHMTEMYNFEYEKNEAQYKNSAFAQSFIAVHTR